MIGSAVEQATKLNSNITPNFTVAGQYDKLNKRFAILKGVGAMSESIKKMTVAPTLPKFDKAAVIQPGNSTHESLFGVAFYFKIFSFKIIHNFPMKIN